MNDPYLREALEAVVESDGGIIVLPKIRTGDLDRLLDAIYRQLGDDPSAYAQRIRALPPVPTAPPPRAGPEPGIPPPAALSPNFAAQMDKLNEWFQPIDERQSRAIRNAGMQLARGDEAAARAALVEGM